MSLPMNQQDRENMNIGVTIIPGQKWGTYKTASGQVFTLEEVSDQVYYDSEIIPIVVGAGTQYRMCQSPTFVVAGAGAKIPQHDFNLPEWGRVPVGWLFRIQVVGFHFLVGTAFATMRDITNNCFMEFITGSQTVEQDGNIVYYPSGAGMGGSIALDGGGVANEANALNIGVPAVASIIPKRYPIDIPEQASYEARIYFPIGLAVAADPLLIARYGAVLGAGFGAQLYVAMRLVRYRMVR